MVWAVHILHTWALWAGSVNLVTAQEFCPVYYFMGIYGRVTRSYSYLARVLMRSWRETIAMITLLCILTLTFRFLV